MVSHIQSATRRLRGLRVSLKGLLLFLVVFLGGSVSSGFAAEALSFRAGISTISDPFVLQMWMAQASGLYKKHGVNVEIIDMGGGTRGLQVLLSGEIQAMLVGLGPMVRANTQGADLRLISSFCNTIPFTIFTPPNVKTASDLKGSTLGISSFGSESDIAMDIMLKKSGLTRKDVTIAQIGGGSTRLAALLSGRVKAVPLQEPLATKAHDLGLNAFLDLAAAKVPWVFEGVVVKRVYFEKNRDLFTRLVRANIEGTYMMFADEKRAKELVGKIFKTGDSKLINAGYNAFKQVVPLDPLPSQAGAEHVLEQLEAIGPAIGSKKLDDHIDTSIPDALKKEGLFAELSRQYKVQ
jgi:ABC-type nitrate/sulfonate/bicarbonate transport system substrate-binding protein